MSDPWTEWHTVATNGVELHFVEQGVGAPLIFVHGNGATEATPTTSNIIHGATITCYT
jgi:hypothetical protein